MPLVRLAVIEEPTPLGYQCPGEPYPISRAIHLGRLASFYAKCRQCPHRDDTDPLPRNVVKRLADTRQRVGPSTCFTDEGVAGVLGNELTAADVRQVAAALGAWLRQKTRSMENPPEEHTVSIDVPDIARPAGTRHSAPSVVIAGDARPLASELVAAASEGLRWSGCGVIDIGGATAPCLALAVDHLRATGGLLVGNPSGKPHQVGLKFWGPGARPLSAGHELEAIRRISQSGALRPTRACGGLGRFQAEELYLTGLQPYFHALRPLRVVLDTSSQPLVDYLRKLSTTVACEILLCRSPARCSPPAQPAEAINSAAASRRPSQTPAKPAAETALAILRARAATGSIGGHLPAGVAQRVRAEGAHFGLWIDGDGEACRLFDERGQVVPPEQLLLVVALRLVADRPGAAIVLESDTPPGVAERLSAAGADVASSAPGRAALDARLRSCQALAGGGPSGQLWFGTKPPAADALRALALLLALLSRSDLPLSEVVRHAAGPARKNPV